MLRAMRVLFLIPSQFRSWEQEPANHELRLPIVQCGVVGVHRTYDYKAASDALGRAAMLAELRELARDFVPDVIVYANTLRDWRLSPDDLRSLRGGAAKIVGMLWDTYDRPSDQEMEYFQTLDGLIVGDSLFAYTRYRLLAEHHYTNKTVLFLPGHQVLSEFFHPGDGAKIHDVSHIGTLYGVRGQFIESLARGLPPHRTISAFGGLFDRIERRRVDNLVLYDYAASQKFLKIDAYAEIMRQSHCCLSLQADAGSARVRGKTFEILASRAVCILEDTKQYRLLLPEDAVVMAASPSDAADKIAGLLDDPAELSRRAGTGYEWFRDTFDIDAFWRDGLSAILAGATPELRAAHARAAYEGLTGDLFAHYKGPPSEDSLMKLIFS